jgi:glucose/arabinose dehydrogenase
VNGLFGRILSAPIQGDPLVKMSSVAARVAVSAAACTLFVIVAVGTVGLAQQPPAGGGQPAAGAGRQGGVAPADGRGGGRGGRGGRGVNLRPLGDGPWEYQSGTMRYRVTVVTKGVVNPWGIAFLPDGDLLVTERPGRLRVIRTGVLDPTPIGPLPDMLAEGLGGMMDVSLHPQFAQNRLIYFTYSKRHPDPTQCPPEAERQKFPPNKRPPCSATTAVARARWDGGSMLTDLRDIIVTDAWHGGPGSLQGIGPATGSYGSRLAWDRNGLLYVTTGDRNYPQFSQMPGNHNGKILRIRDDGSVPPDNPFVGKPEYLPEIYTLGHRNPLGLWYRESTGELWSTEQGPQGGDELNLIQAGKNYGWPLASLGRNYDGTIVGKGFTAPGVEDPVVFWVPALANSGLSFYDGDKLPAWKGQAFVGAMRGGTGQFIARVTFNAKGLPTARDHSVLADLRQRIREVKPSPDGFIYVLTDEAAGAVLRIEPVTPPAAPASEAR